MPFRLAEALVAAPMFARSIAELAQAASSAVRLETSLASEQATATSHSAATIAAPERSRLVSAVVDEAPANNLELEGRERPSRRRRLPATFMESIDFGKALQTAGAAKDKRLERLAEKQAQELSEINREGIRIRNPEALQSAFV